MDVPCPKYNSTNLQKVSLAREEVLYRCDKRAQLHGVLLGSGGVGACRICSNTSAYLLSSETFVVQVPVATAASKSLLAARQQDSVAGITLRAES